FDSISYVHRTRAHRHSFPTRRSSDLLQRPQYMHFAMSMSKRVMTKPPAALSFVASITMQSIGQARSQARQAVQIDCIVIDATKEDRKSTRLNSSHQIISYAVFCLKKK